MHFSSSLYFKVISAPHISRLEVLFLGSHSSGNDIVTQRWCKARYSSDLVNNFNALLHTPTDIGLHLSSQYLLRSYLFIQLVSELVLPIKTNLDAKKRSPFARRRPSFNKPREICQIPELRGREWEIKPKHSTASHSKAHGTTSEQHDGGVGTARCLTRPWLAGTTSLANLETEVWGLSSQSPETSSDGNSFSWRQEAMREWDQVSISRPELEGYMSATRRWWSHSSCPRAFTAEVRWAPQLVYSPAPQEENMYLNHATRFQPCCSENPPV